jgi:hypothetical protein
MDNSSVAFLSQLTLAAVSHQLLVVLQKSKWFPLLQEDSGKVVKVLFRLITSACAITGLSYHYDSTAHTLLIQNFSLMMVLTASWHWLTQYTLQEGWTALRTPAVVAQPAAVGVVGTIDKTAEAVKAQKVAAAQAKLKEAQDELSKAQQ